MKLDTKNSMSATGGAQEDQSTINIDRPEDICQVFKLMCLWITDLMPVAACDSSTSFISFDSCQVGHLRTMRKYECVSCVLHEAKR